MTFRASNVLPQVAYLTTKQAAVALKSNLVGMVIFLATDNTDYDYLREIYRTLQRADNQFDKLKTTPGLSEYAKIQENDQTYDVIAAFLSMQTSITNAMDWLAANIPTSVTTKPVASWDDNTLISNTFTPAQTAGLRNVLNLVVAEID